MFALYVYGKFVGCAKPRDLLVLNISPLADHSCFIKESYRFRDATFHIFYPAYAYKVQLLVYNDLTLWDSEEEQNASFCYAILNYKYKRNDVLFSYVVKVTQSHIDFDKFPCPNLEGEIANCYKRLNFIHQNHETLLQQRLEAGQPVDSFTTDDRLEVMRISPSSRIEPVVETGGTTVSIEENNLSHPVANNEQSQLETDEPTQLDDERETHNIHSQLILNVLYP